MNPLQVREAEETESAKCSVYRGVIQGYNSQALIDGRHQVIIHA